MSYFSRMCFLLMFFNQVYTLPAQMSTQSSDLELQSNYFEGDIILNSQQQQQLAYLRIFQKARPRNALVDKSYLWPNKLVPYRIDKEFSRDQVQVIELAISQIASQTCLQFQSAPTSSSAYVYIQSNYNGGCSAAVGYQRREQLVRLHPDCVHVGTVIHELLHAIGLYHEQSSSERDRYVRIRLDNVLPGKEHNFAKYPAGFVSDYGIGYDYESIMHYGSRAFSRNGLETIQPLNAGVVRLGQRQRLSPKDVMKIKKMYGC